MLQLNLFSYLPPLWLRFGEIAWFRFKKYQLSGLISITDDEDSQVQLKTLQKS